MLKIWQIQQVFDFGRCMYRIADAKKAPDIKFWTFHIWFFEGRQVIQVSFIVQSPTPPNTNSLWHSVGPLLATFFALKYEAAEYYRIFWWIPLGGVLDKAQVGKCVSKKCSGRNPWKRSSCRNLYASPLPNSLPCPRGPHTPNNSQSTSRHPIPKR